MIYAGFDGRVLFDCTPHNMRELVVTEALRLAVPEWKTWDGQNTLTLFVNLAAFLGRTKNLEVVPGEPNSIIDDLCTFWQFAQNTVDYRAIWEAFLFLDPVINSEWAAALASTVDVRLLAPAVLQPAAPPDEVLEAQPDGKKKSPKETHTSKRLTGAPPPS